MKPGLLHTWPLTRYAGRTAVVFGNRRISFGEMDKRVNRLARGFMALGLTPGHKVGLLLNNSLEAVECLLAVPRAGLTFVALNARHTAAEHAYVLQDAGVDAVVVGSEFLALLHPVLAALPALRFVIVVGTAQCGHLPYERIVEGQPDTDPGVEVDEDAIERIHYTSGTTGRPKGAVSTFRIAHNRMMNVLVNLDHPILPTDVNLNVGPLTHAAGFMMSIYYVRGASNIILSGFDPEETLRTIQRERVTSVLLIPTMLYRILTLPGLSSYDLGSVKRVWYGTAPMAPDRLQQGIALFGPVFRQNYGLTEAPQPITYLAPEEHGLDGTPEALRRLSSAGRPALGVELAVVREDGAPVTPGEIGEIVIRTDKLFKEYWKMPEATAEAFRGGWFHTGDMGTLDEEGYLYIMDRKNDMIISGGFNIYPREVEDVLMSHPAVAEAAVIGVPDDIWGEAVKAFVVLKKGAAASDSELIGFCKSRLASYKKPRSVVFVGDLPKNPYGKLLRRELKDRCWKGLARKVH
jgi:acyl-CoA synthetase (AMP-forming)/AMP-acid ligase II